MELWLQTCLLLCSYGFFKEFRPSEPFLTEYLLGPQQNLTESQVYFDVYPVWTYSYLMLLIVVFLVTDVLRYKPVIVFEGIGYVATWCLLLWARGVHWMQFMEFCYGIATATEVAYYTYIYAKVDARYYQKVTSYTRTAILLGRFSAGLSGQVLTSINLFNYHSLNYITLISVIIAFIIALCLPSVRTSIYFHRRKSSVIDAESKEEEKPDVSSNLHASNCEVNGHALGNKKQVWFLIWRDFKEAYSNKYLLKWSIWWSFATCINFQVGNYIQPLWESILPYQEADAIYNGAMEASSTLLGALAAFGVGYIHLNWALVGEVALALISLLDCAVLIFMGLTSHIWVAYIGYIGFRSSYQVLITVASYQVAKELKAESYGLVFGLNMFVALLLQSILTVIVAEWLQITPGWQFVIYGSYFGALSLLFFVISCYNFGFLGMEGVQSQGIFLRANSSQDRREAPVGTTEPY